MKSLVLLLFFVMPIHAALAIDPGTAKGSLRVNGTVVPLTQSFAHLHDNAEKLLDRPKELRIVLADREIPQEALAGIAFPPVMQMARDGKVRGLLLWLDPGDRKRVLVTLLYPPKDPRNSLATLTLGGGSQDALKKLDIGGNRVIGEIEYRDSGASAFDDMPKFSYSIQFSAPVFNERPVTADLKRKEAHDSPQVRVLRDKARALAKADFAAMRLISTERANKVTDAFLAQAGAQAKAYAKEAAADIEKLLKKLERVVVRGERAVAIFGKGEWMTFARESGEWRSDD